MMGNNQPTFAEQAEAMLGSRDYHTLCHALAVAAERFDHDAATFEQTTVELSAWEQAHPGQQPAIITAAGAAMSAQIFRRQATDTRAVLSRVRGDDEDDA